MSLVPFADDGPTGKLDLLSVNDLAHRLRCPRQQIEEIACTAGRYYEPFVAKPKPRWFPKRIKPDKRRVIDNPVGAVKELQQQIQQLLLKPLAFPYYMCGGIKGKNLIDNVSMHIGAPVLVTLDIKSFFPTISTKAVYAVWHDLLGCSPPVSGILTRLTTYKRHLPQGAPTSTLLANLVLYTLDNPIRALCEANGVHYSTWIDDLALSGQQAPMIIETAISALHAGGFSISHKKLRIMGSGDQKLLNGVLLNRFPNVVQQRIKQLRSGIHKLTTGEVPPCDLERYCTSLHGAIQQLKTINPRRATRLQDEFERAIKPITGLPQKKYSPQ